MLYSYNRPALTITAPAGGAILTDPARLTNGRPRSKTRCTWTAGAQTTSTTMALQCIAGSAFVPRMAAILGTDLPVGLPMQAQTFNGSTWSNVGSADQVRATPTGGRIVCIVLPTGLAATTGVRFVFTNNIGGSTVLTAGQEFTLGEAWPSGGDDIDIEPGYAIGFADSTKTTWSRDQQPQTRIGVPQRTLTFTPAAAVQDTEFGTGAGTDLGAIYASMLGGQPILCVPRYKDASGVYSSAITARNAIFGLASQLPGYSHAAGPWYTNAAIKVAEAAM